MKVAAIIAAAGIGRRMGGGKPKQYLEIGGRPIICHTLDRFRQARGISEVVIVVEPGRSDNFREEIIAQFDYPPSWVVADGGLLRQQSVANGLTYISLACDVILVHDGVRPFIGVEEIGHVAQVAFRDGACIVATPLRETVKRVGSDGLILETADRSVLWGAKTPQAFRASVLKEAMAAATRDSFWGTDESSLVERLGVKVRIIEGRATNIKITTPEDFIIAEAILKNEAHQHV